MTIRPLVSVMMTPASKASKTGKKLSRQRLATEQMTRIHDASMALFSTTGVVFNEAAEALAGKDNFCVNYLH